MSVIKRLFCIFFSKDSAKSCILSANTHGITNCNLHRERSFFFREEDVFAKNDENELKCSNTRQNSPYYSTCQQR